MVVRKGRQIKPPRRRGRAMTTDGALRHNEGYSLAEEKRRKAGRPPAERPPVNKKWFDDRIRELKLTQHQVAVAIGKDRSVFNKALSGSRPTTAKEIAGLQRVLKVSAKEILRHLGYPVSEEGVPINGRVMGDGRVAPISARKGETLEISGFPQDAHAYVAETEGTPLSAYDGAVFICRRASTVQGPIPPEAVGRLAVVEADAHIVPMLGTINKVLNRGAVAFTTFGSNERLSLQKVHRVEIVLAIKFPS